MRRTTRLLAGAAALCVGIGLLSACTPTTEPTPPPRTSAAPVFASDEEALAAAEEAYGAYLRLADLIVNEGGADPQRLAGLVSPEIYAKEQTGFAEMTTNGWHGTGFTTFTIALQRFDNSEVVAYVCDDFSATDIVNSAGESVVGENRRVQYAYEVSFDVAQEMLLVGKSRWEGGNVC